MDPKNEVGIAFYEAKLGYLLQARNALTGPVKLTLKEPVDWLTVLPDPEEARAHMEALKMCLLTERQGVRRGKPPVISVERPERTRKPRKPRPKRSSAELKMESEWD